MQECVSYLNSSPGDETVSGQLLFHCYLSFSEPARETELQPTSDQQFQVVELKATVLALGLMGNSISLQCFFRGKIRQSQYRPGV